MGGDLKGMDPLQAAIFKIGKQAQKNKKQSKKKQFEHEVVSETDWNSASDQSVVISKSLHPN